MESHEYQVQVLSNAMEDLIIRMKEVDDRCAELSENITTRELHLISFVADNKKVIMKEVADYLHVPMSTATGIVDKLVQREFLQRRHAEYDRRIVQIELGEAGIAASKLFRELKADMAARILTLLDAKETEIFIRLVEKITAGLNQFVEVE